MKKTLVGCAVVAGLLSVLTGCGGQKPPEQTKAKVKGTITLDNKPLQTGHIVFDAGNGQPPADLDILDGKFEGSAPVGKCKVSITSFKQMTMKEKLEREGKKPMDGPGYDQPQEVNLLPDRYNVKSEISREIYGDKANDLTFELKSK